MTESLGSWHAARDEAQSLGDDYNLVTVDDNDLIDNTGDAENDWLTSTFAPANPDPNWSDVELHQATEFWLGFNDEVEEGLWVWASGEGGQWRSGDPASTSYVSWGSGQPDDFGNQDYSIILVPPATWPAGSWDDLYLTGIARRGIIEAVPEPTTLALLSIAAVGLMLHTRRRPK